MSFHVRSLVRFLRIMEPSFPFLQLVPGLPHAFCLLLYGVGGLCGLQKGSGDKLTRGRRERLASVPEPARHVSAGRHGTGVRGRGPAAAAHPARPGHRVGRIGSAARQPGQEEPLW